MQKSASMSFLNHAQDEASHTAQQSPAAWIEEFDTQCYTHSSSSGTWFTLTHSLHHSVGYSSGFFQHL